MSGQFFISLLNPGIGVLLAAAFFVLWSNRRGEIYVLVAAAGYLVNAMGFLVRDTAPSLPHDAQIILANVLFMATACLLSAAILLRYKIAPPYNAMLAISTVAMAGQIWFLLVEPDITARIYFISLGLGAIASILAIKLWPVDKVHIIDRLLFWIACLAAANFILRPVIILQLVEMRDGGGFQQSVYWTTVQFTQAMLSIMIALNLMVAVAIDLLDELRREAKIDKLSGLLNRKGFEVEAADALARHAHDATPACLLLADLDHFKQVNDTFGHAAGDAVISVFGAAIKSAGPEAMIAGRIGGEEFAMLLLGVELGDARSIAEDIRITLSEAAIGRLPPGLTPTASIGVYIAPARAGLSELLRHADLSLYQAKRAGRNRVEVSAPALAAAAV